MIAAIAAVLLVIWLVLLVVHVVGWFIHLLLVAALVIIAVKLLRVLL
jgi:hypothetical protein